MLPNTNTAAEKLNAIVPAKQEKTEVISVGLMDSQSFEMTMRVAKCFSQSSLVPKEYQGQNGLANCIIALNMAQRIKADPIMTMQNLVIIHGRPSWSAQFLIATFNSCGRFSSIRYKFVGEKGKDDWGCIAMTTELATGETLEGTLVTIEMAKKEGWYGKSGSKWQTMPQQMLMYRAASWLVRAYAPEIGMGLHTAEEIGDTYDMEQDGGQFTLKRSEAGSLNELINTDTGEVVVRRAEEPVKVVLTAEKQPEAPKN